MRPRRTTCSRPSTGHSLSPRAQPRRLCYCNIPANVFLSRLIQVLADDVTTTRQMTICRHRFEQPFFWISAIKHFVIRLDENSLIPRLCIRARSSFPCSSTKLMFVRSTTSAASPVEHSCQHLSSSCTHGPASFPSRKSMVADESFLAVILIIVTSSGTPATIWPYWIEHICSFGFRQVFS